MTSNTKPKVSIVCTNYNKGEWIKEAMDSFLKQKTDFPFEIIMIDDKSTDDSDKIIKEYAKKYPEIVRAHFNTKNLGITKTWIKVCKFAKGEYIARCDGDDYWINNKKLQMQVDALRKNKKSKWCSTDYDIVTPSGHIKYASAFEKGITTKSLSYAHMLATKGFTMSSTWIVDTKLMQEVNEQIDTSAIDDTYNIQLELFKKTELTYIPISTAAYRKNEGSDSNPIKLEDKRRRRGLLLQTQLEYINKYNNYKYKDIIIELLKHSLQFETWSEERLDIIKAKDRLLKEKDEIIQEKEDVIKEKDKAINDIINSKKYRIMTKFAKILKKLKIG